jgi:hypothetical protein
MLSSFCLPPQRGARAMCARMVFAKLTGHTQGRRTNEKENGRITSPLE